MGMGLVSLVHDYDDDREGGRDALLLTYLGSAGMDAA